MPVFTHNQLSTLLPVAPIRPAGHFDAADRAYWRGRHEAAFVSHGRQMASQGNSKSENLHPTLFQENAMAGLYAAYGDYR